MRVAAGNVSVVCVFLLRLAKRGAPYSGRLYVEDYQVCYNAIAVHDNMRSITQFVDAERQVFVGWRLKMRPFGRYGKARLRFQHL